MLLSERSEFQHFPIFCDAQIMLKRSVSTQRASLRSPFLAYLFWRSKKGKWLSGHTRPSTNYASESVKSDYKKQSSAGCTRPTKSSPVSYNRAIKKSAFNPLKIRRHNTSPRRLTNHNRLSQHIGSRNLSSNLRRRNHLTRFKFHLT